VTARALAAAVILVLAGCEGPGILYTLATEHPRDNHNLPDELTVTAVVSADGHYYVAAGGMWRRPHAGDTWQEVSRPAPDVPGDEAEELLVLGLAASGDDTSDDDTLCAGTERGLFVANAGSKPNWRRASGVAATEQVLRVFTIPDSPDGEILAITQPQEDRTAYRVYQSRDCRSFDAVAPLQDVAGRAFDAVYAFDEYWVTVGDRVYRGATLAGLDVAEEQPDGAGRYRGVFLNDARDRLYVADENGNIHWRGRAEPWTSAPIEPPAESVEAVPLTLFAEIRGTILVGTEGFGFYQFPDGQPDRAVRGARITSQLYEAHITGFARFDGDGAGIVFAATAVAGLSSLGVSNADGNFGTWDWE
jgi:hypothetical protein